MWMLVRADADTGRLEDGGRVTTLAASPDTAGRGDPWRWSVRLVGSGVDAGASADHPGAARTVLPAPGGAVLEVLTDPASIEPSADLHVSGEALDLTRDAGAGLVVVPLAGQALVSDQQGPWRRWLAPGDVFVVEGEEDERLRLTPAPGDSIVALVTLTPTDGRPLRWVP